LAEVSEEDLARVHHQHKAEVMQFFAEHGPHRLGVFDLESPDIGQDIAAFLGLVPNKPFPALGATDSK
jgi:hypothetical protein